MLRWVWVKIKPPGDHRFWSMLPFTRIPFWVHSFDPQPNDFILCSLVGLKGKPFRYWTYCLVLFFRGLKQMEGSVTARWFSFPLATNYEFGSGIIQFEKSQEMSWVTGFSDILSLCPLLKVRVKSDHRKHVAFLFLFAGLLKRYILPPSETWLFQHQNRGRPPFTSCNVQVFLL